MGKKIEVEPLATIGNKEVYRRTDAEKVARAYKAFQSEKSKLKE